MKKERGITLIALVITIIVLLILAGVSISLVVGNNGVLTQAKNATEAHRTATAEEEIAMAWGSLESDYLSAWTNNLSTTRGSIFTKANIEKYLEGTVDEFKYNENGTGSITYKSNTSTKNEAEKFEIDENGKVMVVKEIVQGEIVNSGPWTQDGTIVTNSITNQNVEVGDTVYYDSGVTTYEGTGENQGKWGILGTEDGKLLLMSKINIQSIEINGKEDYLTEGTIKLNNACIPYKNSTYADSVRSVKVEDINRVTGYAVPEPKSYTYTMVSGYVKRNDLDSSTWAQKFEDVNGNELSDNSPISVISDSYEYNLTDSLSQNGKAYKLINISDKNKYYWLDSKEQNSSQNYADWGFRLVSDNTVSWNGVWNSSFGKYNYNYNGVRPVIILKEDVKLSGSSSSGWTIQ